MLVEALSLGGADMLLNVTVPEAHLSVSTASLRAGVPVLSEKPVTPTVYEALLLTGLSDATGVLLATSQSRRHSPGIRGVPRCAAQPRGRRPADAQFFRTRASAGSATRWTTRS